MDYLTEMQKLQVKVDNKHNWRNDCLFEERVVHLIDALDDEVHELKREFNWKKWKNKKPICQENVKTELMDCLVFFNCICIELKITPKELFDRYKVIANRNINRQKEGY